jgi:hypothetical protein
MLLIGSWDPSQLLIHVYCSQLWDVNYREHIYNICDYFLAPLYKAIFGFYPHRISQGAINALREIGDWYIKKYYTYVRIYGAIGPPHLLSKYVPDKLLVREISYQTIEKGVTSYLSEKNKKYWPIFPLHIGRHTLSNKPHAEKEAEALREICLFTGSIKGHDPQNVVYEHIKVVNISQ